MTPFPWAAAMQFGFGVLRLPSSAFWAMTPRELAAAYAVFDTSATPLQRGRLDELMRHFPDKELVNGGC